MVENCKACLNLFDWNQCCYQVLNVRINSLVGSWTLYYRIELDMEYVYEIMTADVA